MQSNDNPSPAGGFFPTAVLLQTLLLGVFPNTGQTASVTHPIHEWAVRAGGMGFDTVQGVAVDGAENAYISGFFSETATFGTLQMTRSGPSDAYIAKLDPRGNFLWAAKPAATGADYSGRIAVGRQGEVYVTGSSASARLTFGDVIVTNHSGGGSFLARLDTGGRFAWGLRTARYTSILFSNFPDAVAVDGEGNGIIAGQFDGRMTLGSQSLTNRAVDVYVAKVRADASVAWAVQAGGSSDDIARDVAVDAHGNVYACGFFLSSRATFGSTTLTNRGASALWIAKWDASGTVLWARTAAGKGTDSARAVCVDRAGFVYLGGYLGPSTDFGGMTLTNSSGRESFLAKLDPDGHFLWATNSNSNFGSGINDLATDTQGAVVAAGDFSGRLSLGATTLTNASGFADFVALFNSDGVVQWALRNGIAASPAANSLAVDASDAIVSAGTHDFRSVLGSLVLTNQGSDLHVTRIISRPEIRIRNTPDAWILSWPASAQFPPLTESVEVSEDCSHWQPLPTLSSVLEVGQLESVVDLKLLRTPLGGPSRFFRLRSRN